MRFFTNLVWKPFGSMPNLICIHPFLKNFLLKKFSRICCLLFSYQCSLFCCRLKRQLISIITSFVVCQQLFLFSLSLHFSASRSVSATKTILSFLFVIVNVFLVFYLFRTIQTIHAILTKKVFSSCCSLPCQSLRWLARRMHVLSWTASRPSPKAI